MTSWFALTRGGCAAPGAGLGASVAKKSRVGSLTCGRNLAGTAWSEGVPPPTIRRITVRHGVGTFEDLQIQRLHDAAELA